MDRFLSKNNIPQELWCNIIIYLEIDDVKNLLIFFKLLGQKNSELKYYYDYIRNSLYTKILKENKLLRKIININDNASKFTDINYWMKTYSDIYDTVAFIYDKDFKKRRNDILESHIFIEKLSKKNISPNIKLIKSVCSYISRNNVDYPKTDKTEIYKRINYLIDYHF